LQSTSAKSAQLATWETYLGDAGAWKDSIERLEAATPAAVKAVAEKWLTKGSYTLTVLPFGNPAASGQTVDRSKVPEPGAIADVSFPDYQTATLSNGVEVMLVERHDAPIVSIRMILDTGYPADQSTIRNGLGSLTASLLDEGTTSRSALEIADELDRLGASVFAGGGGEETSVEMSSLTPTLDQVIAIWADVIRNPAFNEADFKRIQAQQVQGLQQAMLQPNSIGSRVMSKVLWGQDHPYGRLVLPADVQKLTPADTKAFHDGWFGPNNATLFVVGDTTMAEIKPKLEAALAGWEDAPNEPRQVANGTRPASAQVYLVDRPGSLQSVILVGTPQPPRNPADDQRVSAFNALFGGNFDSRVNM